MNTCELFLCLIKIILQTVNGSLKKLIIWQMTKKEETLSREIIQEN